MMFACRRLLALKEKLKKQREHLDELDKHMFVSRFTTPQFRELTSTISTVTTSPGVRVASKTKIADHA